MPQENGAPDDAPGDLGVGGGGKGLQNAKTLLDANLPKENALAETAKKQRTRTTFIFLGVLKRY